MEARIIDDAVANELPEVFQVNFILSQQDQQGSEIINPVSMVTIIDDDVGEFVNCYLALTHIFSSLHTHIHRPQGS